MISHRQLGQGVAAEVHHLGGGTVSDDLRQQQPELSTMYRTWAALKKLSGCGGLQGPT